MSKYYAVQQAEKSADIYIFGDITTEPWFDGEVSAYSLVREIEGMKDMERINVHIDSYGGVISEGWAIYNALLNHPAKIVTYADGFVASAAIFPFLAGDERRASNVSAFFLHEGWTTASGYADELRARADELETLTGVGVNAFTARTGMEAAEVERLMAAETWLTPEQALEYGIATSIVPDPGARRDQSSQSAKRIIIQRAMGAASPPAQEKAFPAEDPATPINTQPEHGIMQTLAGFISA